MHIWYIYIVQKYEISEINTTTVYKYFIQYTDTVLVQVAITYEYPLILSWYVPYLYGTRIVGYLYSTCTVLVSLPVLQYKY